MFPPVNQFFEDVRIGSPRMAPGSPIDQASLSLSGRNMFSQQFEEAFKEDGAKSVDFKHLSSSDRTGSAVRSNLCHSGSGVSTKSLI